jgi:hypothetical protein
MNGNDGWLRTVLLRLLTPRSDSVVSTFLARLPSKLAEAQFQATIQITWPPGTHIDQRVQAIAKRQVLQAARSEAEKYSVLDADEARAAIDMALWDRWQRSEDPDPVLAKITAMEVGLDDRRAAEKQDGLRRQTALAGEERLQEAERLQVLANEILAKPTLARLWWLEGKPAKLEDLVAKDKDDMFVKVAEIFDVPAGHPATDPIAELIGQFLQGLNPLAREHLIVQLGHVFSSYERDDLASRLSSYHHLRADMGRTATLTDVDGRVHDPGRG